MAFLEPPWGLQIGLNLRLQSYPTRSILLERHLPAPKLAGLT
jgi:hypothetical protein